MEGSLEFLCVNVFQTVKWRQDAGGGNGGEYLGEESLVGYASWCL